MLSQLFLAVWLFVAFPRCEPPGSVWLLPLVQLVWVNCHALFVLGLVIVPPAASATRSAAPCWEAAWGLPRSPTPNWRTFRTRSIAGLLAIAASLVNPYFEEGALFP